MRSRATLALSSGTRSGGPWSRRQLGALLVAQLLGLFLVGIGWFGAGGTGRPTVGLRWLGLSALGLLCAGIANGVWLGIARRRVILSRLQLLGPGALGVRRRRPTRPTLVRSAPTAELVTHRQSIRYHRRACDLMSGRDPRAATRAEHEAVGLRACEVCEP